VGQGWYYKKKVAYQVWYKFEGDPAGVGSNIVNSGSGPTGTNATNAAFAMTLTGGKYVDCDGSDYGDTHYAPSWTSNHPFTVMAWVWHRGGAYNYAIGVRAETGVSDAWIMLGSGPEATKAWFTVLSNKGDHHTCLTGSGVLTTGVWHHLAGVYDGSGTNSKIYVDGVLKDTHSTPVMIGYITTNTQSFYVGARHDRADPNDGADNHWDGYLDEPIICNVALTSNEVNTLYNDGGSH